MPRRAQPSRIGRSVSTSPPRGIGQARSTRAICPSSGPTTWIALLRGRVRASLAATTGVESRTDLIKYLLAGADVVMTASALLRHGPEHAGVLLEGLSDWMRRKDYATVDDIRGASRSPPKPTRQPTNAPATSTQCTKPTAAPSHCDNSPRGAGPFPGVNDDGRGHLREEIRPQTTLLAATTVGE